MADAIDNALADKENLETLEIAGEDLEAIDGVTTENISDIELEMNEESFEDGETES